MQYHSMQYRPGKVTTTLPSKTNWLWICLGIMVAAEIAALCIAIFGSFDGILLFEAPLFGLIVGVPFWQLFVAGPRRATIGRGALWGAVSGLVVHPLYWIVLWPAYSYINVHTAWDPNVIQIPPPGVPLDSADILLFIIVSLVAIGWFTAAGGAVTGILLVVFQRWQTRRYLRRSPFPKE